MAYLLLRMKHIESVRRSGASAEYLRERAQVSQKTCEHLGFDFIDLCRSVTTGEMLWLLKGSADKVILLQRLMDKTGAYESITCEVLEPMAALIKADEDLKTVAPTFIPPDQAEIDRMLLDE